MLEVGSGSRPHARSTVLLDRFALDASHREGRPLVRDSRPLVVADGAALPFRRDAFDYVVCMHVLEHIEDPPPFLAEMQRVAAAGYIETPSPLHEWLFGVEPYTEIHLWTVDLEMAPTDALASGATSSDGTSSPESPRLVLSRKTPGNSRHRFMHQLDRLRLTDPHLERWMEKSPHLFTTQYEWRGAIRHRTAGPGDADGPGWSDVDSAARAAESRHAAQPGPHYWGSGLWGFKRWLYAAWVHPVWRRRAKALFGRG